MNALPAPLRQKLLAQSTHAFAVVVAFDNAAALNPAKQLCSQVGRASPLADLTRRATALTPCLQAILDRPVGIPRWGINE